MGLLPKTSSLLLRKPRNKSAALAETNGTLMPKSGIHGDELEISSKKLDGVVALNCGTGNMHLVQKTLSDSLPILYAGNLKISRETAKPVLAHPLFDMFKKHNKDPTGECQKEQWVPMRGIHNGTSFSDLCRTGKLYVNFNKNYAACIPKQSGRNQRSTKLMVGYNGNQANLGAQDIRAVPGLLYIGVEDVIYFGADFVNDVETGNPLLAQNSDLEMPLESHTLPSERTKQSRDAAKIGNERGLTILSNLELPGQKNPSLSSDAPDIQSRNDLSVIINKSEQDSPLSVLEQFFEDVSPKLADATTKPSKPPMRPRRINFEEQSPVKHVKLHLDTASRSSIPSKKHISSALEYTKNVLEASGLNWYQLALKWDSSTHMLDPVIYTMMESQTTSQIVRTLETHLLFDHINEVLLDIYQPYHGFYPWIPVSRPNKPHIVTERTFADEIIKTVEVNLIRRHHQFSEQQLVTHSMEKCGTWIDTRRELEDMVLEITEDVTEELLEEFVFEMWID